MPTIEQLESLKAALINGPPFCSGALRLPPEDYLLFFAKGGDGHRLDFTYLDGEILVKLAQACDVATFGVNKEDVLDETYRKAGKLDSQFFAPKLDLYTSGLMQIIRDGLFGGPQAEQDVRAELYKLNVYGPSSFFKAHKDTPRNEKMFGSLVLIFPTPHEGGALILRDKGDEWTLDSAVAPDGDERPEIRYVAFFSDVEHEVAEVKSGYRVTLTYNLYFEKPSANVEHKDLDVHGQKLLQTFQSLLADMSFISDGGFLGFGLQREYAINPDKRNLDYLLDCLKGNDATLLQVCRALGLEAKFNLVYVDRDEGKPVLCGRLIDIEGAYIEEDTFEYLREHGGEAIEDVDGSDDGNDIDKSVIWVTELTDLTTIKSSFVAYGNEPSLEYVYGKGCLIVEVGPYGKRQTTPSAD